MAETDDRVKRNELKELELADQYGAPDVYIDGEADTCWYHWTGTIYVKILRMENRKGCYIIKLKTGPHAELGKHRHRGEVRAYTIAGNWGYHEYSWKVSSTRKFTHHFGTNANKFSTGQAR